MPVVNGFEAASVQEAASEYSHCGLTPYSDPLGQLLAKAFRVDLVISKSEGAAGLVGALGALLAEGRSRQLGETIGGPSKS